MSAHFMSRSRKVHTLSELKLRTETASAFCAGCGKRVWVEYAWGGWRCLKTEGSRHARKMKRKQARMVERKVIAELRQTEPSTPSDDMRNFLRPR